MKLLELQDNDKKTKKLRSKGLSEGLENINQILYYEGIHYVLNLICSKLINKHYNNPFVGHFGIKKTWELIARKYYWLTL